MKKILAIILLLIISLTVYLFVIKKPINKFKELGYNENEIKIINKLNNKDLLFNYKYNENIIKIINNSNFKEENLKNYILFDKYNFSIDDNIFVVNNNYYDTSIKYTNEIISLMKEQYYIHTNLNRYLTYKKDSLTNTEIIKRVNSNLDYPFYTNTKDADISKGYLMLVNKYYKLSKDYIPNNLVKIESKYGVSYQLESKVYEQFKLMYEDAIKNNLSLFINSPYRSYSTQESLYNNYVKRDGIVSADSYSARPGYSEHQTGLAFDVTSKSTNFSNFAYSKEYTWLQENAYKYGFILRYPKGKEYITGYQYESWHYRYVGQDVAQKIKDLNITFEEYYAYFLK